MLVDSMRRESPRFPRFSCRVCLCFPTTIMHKQAPDRCLLTGTDEDSLGVEAPAALRMKTGISSQAQARAI